MRTSFEFTTRTLLSSEYFANAQIDAQAFLHKMGNLGIVSNLGDSSGRVTAQKRTLCGEFNGLCLEEPRQQCEERS